jgi:hypothetical protein
VALVTDKENAMANEYALVTRVGTALAALVIVATAAWAGTMFRLEIGPPVAGGTDFKLKGAVLVVRAVVCDDLTTVRITGTAEGMINGQRQSVGVRLIETRTPGVYAVQQQWPAEGHWVLHLAGECGSPTAAASTIVPMRGASFIRAKTLVLREPATRTQVEAALADLVRSES